MLSRLAFAVIVALASCKDDSSSGKCRGNQLLVSSGTATVIAVAASGAACGSTTCLRSQTDAACTAFSVSLLAAGACDVTITRSDGTTYVERVTVVANPASGDCAGELRPDRDLVAAAPDAGVN